MKSIQISAKELAEFLEKHENILSRNDLGNYKDEVEQELKILEEEQLEEFHDNRDDLDEMDEHLGICDDVLKGMETNLKTVQSKLLGISWEIKQLQQKSFLMNIHLRNRRNVEKKTAKFIFNTFPSPKLCLSIFDADVNEEYLQNIKQLDKKYDAVHQYSGDDVKAVSELLPKIDQICQKAVSKIRHFLLDKLSEITKPNTNPQFFKTNVLLKFKYFIQFLGKHNANAKTEINAAYIDMIGNYYFFSFKTYISNLLKLEKKRSSQSILIVPNFTKTWYGTKIPNVDAIWRLENRHEILKQEISNPIVCHIAKQQGDQLEFEEIFRSILILLTNTATSEYIFGLEFFRDRTMHDKIFQRSTELILSTITSYIDGTHDVNCILIMLQLTSKFQRLMEERTVSILDHYLMGINMLLIKKFKTIFDENLKSVKEVHPEDIKADEFENQTIIKRYAYFAACAHLFNQDESVNQHMIKTNLDTLCTVSKSFITKVSKMEQNETKRTVYMIASCDAVLKTFMKYNLENNDGLSYNHLLQECVSKFVESIIFDNFSYMLEFVNSVEHLVSKKFPHVQNQKKVDVHLMEDITSRFKDHWEEGFQAVYGQIKSVFKEQKLLSKAIAERALTQVILDYQRFRNIIYLCFKNPPFRLNLVHQDRLKKRWEEILQE